MRDASAHSRAMRRTASPRPCARAPLLGCYVSANVAAKFHGPVMRAAALLDLYCGVKCSPHQPTRPKST
eukprot:scaffold75401_cov33-Tisochrysis_lutea.AAC.2